MSVKQPLHLSKSSWIIPAGYKFTWPAVDTLETTKYAETNNAYIKTDCTSSGETRTFCTIDWGDGTPATTVKQVPKTFDWDYPCNSLWSGDVEGNVHTYANAGTYTITTDCPYMPLDYNLFCYTMVCVYSGRYCIPDIECDFTMPQAAMCRNLEYLVSIDEIDE